MGSGEEVEEDEVGGWTWNLRMFWFSMRWRRRAEIHFWGAKEVGVGGEDGEEEEVDTAVHHFQMRWPAEALSGAPRTCLQFVQWREVDVVWVRVSLLCTQFDV